MKKITILFLLLSVSYTFYGQTKIKGFVSDETGPLPGANVLIKNSKTGVVSDMDGYYEIEAKTSDTLSISYLGYNTQHILVDNQKTINTELEGNIALDEVVIVDYGSIKCTDIIGCGWSTITAKDLNKFITPSLYPNPSKNGQFQVKLLDSYNNVQIQIVNISGQLIKTQQYQNKVQNIGIDLSTYPQGMYIINITADGKHLATKKAIIG